MTVITVKPSESPIKLGFCCDSHDSRIRPGDSCYDGSSLRYSFEKTNKNDGSDRCDGYPRFLLETYPMTMKGAAGRRATCTTINGSGTRLAEAGVGPASKERSMSTMSPTMTKDEKDRDALATRMRHAIIRELIPDNDRAEEAVRRHGSANGSWRHR